MDYSDENPEKVKVIISGAGLGGLTLGILLERANISYLILEQAEKFIRIGSAISLSANVLPLFEQLGVLPQIMAKSKPVGLVQGYSPEKMKPNIPINYKYTEQFAGYLTRIITHPDLYEILYSLLPRSKILWGKRVIDITSQSPEDGVTVECTDGSTLSGQILVGADGAHSAVRDSMFGPMKKGSMSDADLEPLAFNGVCLLGETKPLSKEKFPELAEPTSCFRAVYGGKKPFFWTTLTTANNTICWAVFQFFDKKVIQSVERIHRWKSQPAGEMCEALKDLPIPFGKNLTLQDLMMDTQRTLLSKVMHEEKLFSTWYHDRTVLIGDACHKMSMAGGMGAVCALQDVIVLANYLNALPDDDQWAMNDITAAFKGYKDERYKLAKDAYYFSHNMGQVMGTHWTSKSQRQIANFTPDWIWKIILRKVVSSRPQVAFLPKAEVKGSVLPCPQPSLTLQRPGASAPPPPPASPPAAVSPPSSSSSLPTTSPTNASGPLGSSPIPPARSSSHLSSHGGARAI